MAPNLAAPLMSTPAISYSWAVTRCPFRSPRFCYGCQWRQENVSQERQPPMSRPLRKIDVDGLRVGMYVSQLDRPWLETPFLFQGFFIRNNNEIEELRRYCSFVEIDIEESDPRIVDTLTSSRVPLARSGTPKSTQKRPGWIGAFLKRLFRGAGSAVPVQPRAGEYYRDSVSTADELIVARSIHTGAIDKLMHILDHIRNGGTI